MKQDDLIKQTAIIAGITQKQARECLDAMMIAIKDALQNGDDVQVREFGKFYVKERRAMTFYSIATKQTETSPPRKMVRFKAARGFKLD